MRAKRFLVAEVAAVMAVIAGIGYATQLRSPASAARCSGVHLAPGSNIQRAINAHGPGTTFCLAGNYTTARPITPKNGDRFIGMSETNISSTGSGVFAGGKHVTYINLGIGPSKGDGLRPGDRSIIKNSRIHGNPKCGVTTAGNSLLIAGNTIAHNGSTATNPISQACGLKIHGYKGADSGAYSTISGNVVHDNVHTALWIDCNGHDNVFANNTVYNNTGIALDAETSYRNTFRGNTVYRNGFGFDAPAVSILDSRGIVVENNTFAHNHRGVYIWTTRRATLSSPQVGAGCADTTLTGYIPAHIRVRGNAFTTMQRVGFAPNGVDVSAALFDTNCYTVERLSDTNWQLPSDPTVTWEQWRNAGKDPNGIVETSRCGRPR